MQPTNASLFSWTWGLLPMAVGFFSGREEEATTGRWFPSSVSPGPVTFLSLYLTTWLPDSAPMHCAYLIGIFFFKMWTLLPVSIAYHWTGTNCWDSVTPSVSDTMRNCPIKKSSLDFKPHSLTYKSAEPLDLTFPGQVMLCNSYFGIYCTELHYIDLTRLIIPK